MESKGHINRYLPVAILYFFFNSLFLPLGLLYTTLLAPIFFIWVCLKRKPTGIFYYLSAVLAFACIHIWNGANPLYYLQSSVILLATYIFCLSFYVFVRNTGSLRSLFKDLVIINAVFTVLALILFPVPGLRELVWYNNSITSGVKDVQRLKMFTYEASYYSTLLAPLVLYYGLKALILKPAQRWLLFSLVTVPVLLSLSFGVISALFLTVVFVYLSDLRLLVENRKTIRIVAVAGLAGLLGVIILYKLSPNNVLFVRLGNIFEGKDTSFRGRTTDSFFIAWRVASKKSILFGVGPGQIKLLAVDILRQFYRSNTFTQANTSIPNSLAETLAIYGIIGMVARLGAEIYFFFRTKVYTNYYRLGLFLFIFIYQFTGSFITNIAEYVIWILAFTPGLFPEFDKWRRNAEGSFPVAEAGAREEPDLPGLSS